VAGLTETAAIAAVALNKLPIAMLRCAKARARSTVARRDGPGVPHECVGTIRHVVLRSFAPTLRRRPLGLSLVWKIVLIVELLGRPNGVASRSGRVPAVRRDRILAYALASSP